MHPVIAVIGGTGLENPEIMKVFFVLVHFSETLSEDTFCF